jgi:ABC-2 type transport system permease protein
LKGLYVGLIVAAVLAARIAVRVSRRRRKRGVEGSATRASETRIGFSSLERRLWGQSDHRVGEVRLVATREIRERLRGRIFRVGTVVMVIAVAAAVVIPALHKSAGSTLQKIGVVGAFPGSVKQVVVTAAKLNDDTPRFVRLVSPDAAKSQLRSGSVDMVIVDSSEILLDQPVDSSKSSADAGLVKEVAQYLGVLEAYRQAGITPSQATRISHARPVEVHSLVSRASGATRVTSVIGLVLLFFMLTQYCTWILIGVMQEKSSRVVEVLLAMVRPIQLLGGKVLGIGIVALGQAALVVGTALALGAAVGSDLLKGTAPLTLLAELAWLVLGYAFYCWVYAAAGSTAERQDQVQTLALPLSLPILFAYIYSITIASSGNANLFFKVLAYLPPTAPFCMSVLVGLSQVTWWEFAASVLVSVVATAGTALFAARIYRRAVLRTGSRVRLAELMGRPARG